MNIKNLSCAIFLLMLTFSCNLSKSIPNMPNVSKKMFSVKSNASADYAGLIPLNDVITVPLNSKPKEYKFYGFIGQVVKINQKSIDNLNCSLQLFDPNGAVLGTNSSTSGLATITFTLTSTGMHSVSIGSDSSANATGTYQVSINGDTGNSHPVVAMQENGDFVVAWQRYSQTNGWDIYGRRYFSNGKPKGDEFLVNGTVNGDQMHPTISISKQGGYFTIAWEGKGSGDDTGIFMQRFLSDGSLFYPYSELKLNYLISGVQSNPSVSEGVDGSTLFVWETNGGTESNNGIWISKFGYTGCGAESRVNTTLTGIHSNPKISINSYSPNYGDAIVTWQGNGSALDAQGLSDSEGIYFRKFNINAFQNDGSGCTSIPTLQSPEYRANYKINGIQSNPDVTIFSDGKYVLTWQTNGSSNNTDGIYAGFVTVPVSNPPSDLNADRYLSLGEEILVNQTNTTDISYPVISSNQASGVHNNDFTVSWMGTGLGDATGIFRRRFNVSSTSPLGSEYRTNLLTDGIQERPAISMASDTSNDGSLANTDLNYSRFVEIWQTRNTLNNIDGVYVTMVKSNNQNIYNEFRVDQKENNGSEPAGIIPFNDVITVAYHNGTESSFISKPKEYKFHGVAGLPVRIKQKGITSNDCYLQLFNPSGVLVAENKNLSGLAQISTILNVTGMWSVKIATSGYINSNEIPNGVYQVSMNADEGASHPVVVVMPNDYTWDQQGFPTTQLHKGDYVVAWQKYSSTTGWDIYARLYNSNGTPKGAEFVVNSTTAGDQIHPSIAINPTGYFSIAWEGNGIGDDSGIFMQRFYPHGATYYPNYELRANSYTSGVSSNPSIVIGENLFTAITWETHGSTYGTDGIWLGRFGYDSLGLETQVNGVLTGTNTNPKSNMNNAGEIAVAWQSSSGNDNYDIHYKRYNINDVNYSTQEIQANYYVNGIQSNPDIVITDDNRMAITWQTNGSLVSLDGIYVRLLNIPNYSDAEFKINTTISNDLSYPSISLNTKNGLYKNDFLVTWMGTGTGDATGIYSRKYNINSGYAQTGEIKLNSLLNGSQEKPVVAFNLNTENDANLLQSLTDPLFSRFITVWQTRSSTDNTNNTNGIYALRSINSYATVENEVKVNSNTTVTGGASND